jgi:FdhE protein
MQIELVELHRRIQSRMSTPLIQRDDAFIQQRMRRGERLVNFEDVQLDWSEFRLVFRQTSDVLRRYDALEVADYAAVQQLARDGARLQEAAADYYVRTPRPDAARPPAASTPAMLDQVLGLALRPFLARCADVWMTRVDPTEWNRAWCLVCGGEADFAVLTSAGDRSLICGRCTAQWPFGTACPFCGNDTPGGVTSFASRDGRYRVYGCNECRKYLKAYDARGAGRPVMLMVDTIATLPLDAAAIQRGYDG